jgi:hypothetical protein
MAKGLAHHVDLAPIPDLTQWLFVEPGACGTGQLGCGDQAGERCHDPQPDAQAPFR